MCTISLICMRYVAIQKCISSLLNSHLCVQPSPEFCPRPPPVEASAHRGHRARPRGCRVPPKVARHRGCRRLQVHCPCGRRPSRPSSPPRLPPFEGAVASKFTAPVAAAHRGRPCLRSRCPSRLPSPAPRLLPIEATVRLRGCCSSRRRVPLEPARRPLVEAGAPTRARQRLA
jgi:hypothetical protein